MLKTILIGYIGSDAITSVINGKNAIKFSVAYNEIQKVGDQIIKKDPKWIRCTYWREPGQSIDIAKHLKKGVLVFLEGVPKEGAYQKDGVTIPVLNLTVYNLRLLSSSEKKEPIEIPITGEDKETGEVPDKLNEVISKSFNELDDFYNNQ